MKGKIVAILLIVILGIMSLAGCNSAGQTSGSDNSYSEISAEEAMDMMSQEENLVILDVRTPEEFAEGYIEGAINIPDTEIATTAEDLILDKSTKILVYCRSGRRSALAAQQLVDLGYSNVYDFGGIIDWKYDVVK